MNPLLLLRTASALLLLRLAGRFVSGLVSGMREPEGSASPKAGGEMVRDRVCNTFVPRERALRAVIRGQEAHFCSSACRDRALSLQPAP